MDTCLVCCYRRSFFFFLTMEKISYLESSFSIEHLTKIYISKCRLQKSSDLLVRRKRRLSPSRYAPSAVEMIFKYPREKKHILDNHQRVRNLYID